MDIKEKNNQKEFSLLDFWYLLKENIAILITITLLFFISISVYAWFIATPDYISNADVMVQVEQDTTTSSDSNFDFVNAFRLIDTIAELMEKEIILNNAINSLKDLGYEEITVEYLRKGLIINSSSTSYFINISFVDVDPLLAEQVVNEVIEAVIEETDVSDAFPVLTDKIRRTSFASESSYNSPNKIFYSTFGLFSGLFVSIAIIFIRELFSNQFKSKEEIEQEFNLPILGVIPLMSFKETKNDKK